MDAIKRAVAKELSARIDAEMDTVFSTTTNTVADDTLTPEKLSRCIEDWTKMTRNARRNSITFVIEGGHEGSPLGYRDPVEGQFFEMSWQQAQALHEQWPMVFVKARDEWTAEFRPAGPMDYFVPKHLPLPPFELLDESE